MIYQPAEDSFLMKNEVEKLASGLRVLDMGSGSGIQAQAALNSGASSVIAVDINPEAVESLRKQGITTIESDLFANVNGLFDLIIFNPPYLPEDKREDKESSLATTGGKKGDEIILKFLKQSKSHLAKQGIILLLVSSLTPKKRILSLMKTLKLQKENLSSIKFFLEELEVWKITTFKSR